MGLRYLAELGVTHSVISAQIKVNPDISGGVLIKLRLRDRHLALVVVNPDEDIELMGALRQFVRCSSLSRDDHPAAEFDRCLPVIGHADWDAITSDNHVVQLGTLAMPTTLDIELLLGSGVKLRLLVSAGAASRLEAALAAALPNRLKHPHIALPPGRA
jgi:hypothetical protein